MTIIANGFYGPKASELSKNIEKKQAFCYFLFVSVLKSVC